MRTGWDEHEFEILSWHDCHVHGLRIEQGEYGAGALELDLDYILEWRSGADGRMTFLLAPAHLTFLGVTRLRVALDYATPTAGMVPFSLDAITRRPLGQSPGWAFSLEVNWPEGAITFDATGLRQRLWGETVESDGQVLDPHQRRPAGPGTR